MYIIQAVVYELTRLRSRRRRRRWLLAGNILTKAHLARK